MRLLSCALRHYALSIVCIALWLASTSCTRNGGDIGIWFGTWAIDSVTVDGQKSELDPLGHGTAYYLQFQRSVVCLRYTDTLHNGGESYGNWAEESGTMTIAFDAHNYDVSLMPQQATYTITTTGKHAELRHTPSEGHQQVYYLTKQ